MWGEQLVTFSLLAHVAGIKSMPHIKDTEGSKAYRVPFCEYKDFTNSFPLIYC
jgi:hypothetical protein